MDQSTKRPHAERRRRTRLFARACGLAVLASALLLCACACAFAASAIADPAPSTAPPPANDTQPGAQAVHSLPASIAGTTVGATSEAGDPTSACGRSTGATVWYSLRAAAAERIAVDLSASGALEAAVDVYHVVRSQLNPVRCDESEVKGKASLSFNASKNGLYLLRVSAIASSQLAPFSLEVFLPTPAVRPPGAPLPSGGVGGQVDPIQNVNAAYAVTLHAGVSYLLNLANGRGSGCVDGRLFAPGTRSFEEGSPVVRVNCGGYRLFTPGAGQGGRYSFEVTPQGRGVHRFHFEVARADSSETAPGLTLGNYAHGHGRLNGNGVHVLRLYRMDVTSHSNLTLKLSAPDSADFNLQLRNVNGRVIECECGDSGSQTLMHQLKPGRYYAVVSVRDNSAGNFTLVRESRTITTTRLSFGVATAHAGQGLAIAVKTSPGASGPVTVDIERFDPVFGWQFYRESHASASGGSASVAFTPPAVGRWRARASYGGSRTFSPSAVGFSYLLVT